MFACVTPNTFASLSSFALVVAPASCSFYLVSFAPFIFTLAFKLPQKCRTCIVDSKVKHKCFCIKKVIERCIHYKSEKSSYILICYFITMVLFCTNCTRYHAATELKLTNWFKQKKLACCTRKQVNIWQAFKLALCLGYCFVILKSMAKKKSRSYEILTDKLYLQNCMLKIIAQLFCICIYLVLALFFYHFMLI